MEALRRKLANENSLYPNLVALGKAEKAATHQSVQSIISVSSTDSTPPRTTQVTKSNNVVILSDSEDDDDVVEVKPTPREEVIVLPEVYGDDPFMRPSDADKALRDLVEGAYHHGDQEVDPEDAVVEGLRDDVLLLPHQIHSRKWMAGRETGKKNGGILADDMGLGKTVQTIVRIVEGRPSKADKKDGWSGTTLVVCPVAVVSQWAAEVKRFAPGLRVVEHHGPKRPSNPYELERAHVVVTSYSVVTSEYASYNPAKDEGKKSKSKKKAVADDSDDSDDSVIEKRVKAPRGGVKDALFRVKFWRVVLDEAHNIKNRTTKAAISCCALDAKYRWCLTGTPMQNSVEELFSLIKFLRIAPLNDWTKFNEQIAKPVKAGRPVRALKRLQVVLRAIMLRRTKTTIINGEVILKLPPRVVKIVDCAFNAEERAFYETVEQKVQTTLDKLQNSGDIQKSYTSILVLLLRLRQACDHAGLISKDYKKDQEAVEPKTASQTNDDEADELADMLAGITLSRKPCQLCQKLLTPENTYKNDVCWGCKDLYKTAIKQLQSDSDLPPHSAKTRKILDLLHEIEDRGDGEKTIIFSQFTSMLDLIEPFLDAERIKYCRYDGSMNKVQRDESLQQIKESKSTRVILISFKAGSTGLNLTCCNNVILVDPWWNPALEDQAFDRAHRFGQKRAVNIHKLCIPETVEQRIFELQDKKRALAQAALSGDKVKNMRLGIDELVALFKPSGLHDDDDDE